MLLFRQVGSRLMVALPASAGGFLLNAVTTVYVCEAPCSTWMLTSWCLILTIEFVSATVVWWEFGNLEDYREPWGCSRLLEGSELSLLGLVAASALHGALLLTNPGCFKLKEESVSPFGLYKLTLHVKSNPECLLSREWHPVCMLYFT